MFQEFPDGSSPRGHPMLESEIVDHRQLFRREHDLQSFLSHIHAKPRQEMSNYLTLSNRPRFRI